VTFSDERVRAMLRGRREVRVYPLPGAPEDSGFTIGVRVLTGEEIDGARTEAAQYAQNLAKQRALDVHQLQWIDGDPHESEVQRQLVFRACVDAGTGEGKGELKPYFPSVTALRQCDDSFVQMLYQLYLGHQQYVNPYFGLDDEQVKEIVDALKKTPQRRALLGLYDVPTLLSLATFMAAQLATAPTGK
jgi:hypothetical protein